MTKKIEAIKLAPGAYVLSQNVKNPYPDLRAARDWLLLEWFKKGIRFLVEERPYEIEDDADEEVRKALSDKMETTVKKVQRDGEWTPVRHWNYDEKMIVRWNALAAHLVWVPTDLAFLLVQENADGETFDIIEQLINSGKISHDDVREAVADSRAARDKAAAANLKVED